MMSYALGEGGIDHDNVGMPMKRRLLPVAVAFVVLAGCSGDGGGHPAHDAGSAGPDASEAGVDAGGPSDAGAADVPDTALTDSAKDAEVPTCVREATAYVSDGAFGAYAIQAAIDAVRDECPAGRGQAVVAEATGDTGVWEIDRTVRVYTNVWLRGVGDAVLKMAAGEPFAFAMVFAGNETHVTISDLRIDGNRANQPADSYLQQGIKLDGTTYSEIFNIEVYDLYGDWPAGREAAGINVRHGSGYDAHVLIHDCRAHDIGGYGIGTWNASFVTIQDSESYSNDSHGFSSAAQDRSVGTDNVIRSCLSTDNARRGFNLENQERSRIVGSTARNNGLSNFRTQNGLDILFEADVSEGSPVDLNLSHPAASTKPNQPDRIYWTGTTPCDYPCGLTFDLVRTPGTFQNGCVSDVLSTTSDFCFIHD